MASLDETRELAAQKKAELTQVLRDCLKPKKMSRREYADYLDQNDTFGEAAREAMADFINAQYTPKSLDQIARNNIKIISGLLALATDNTVDVFGEPLDQDQLCTHGFSYMQAVL